MSLATVDDIVAGLASAQRIPYYKTLSAPKAAGAFQSAWLSGGMPGAGSASPAFNAGAGYACDKSTTGAFPYSNAAVQNWLARISGLSSQPGTIILADRLWSCSGMGFANSTYTVTTPGSLPARITDNGVGCELWVEQFVAAGSASGTLTANYLNTAGASKSGVLGAVVSAPVVGQMQQVPLQAGDLGIKQLTSVTNSATWTSGGWGMTILKRIAEIPIGQSGINTVLDWAACLAAIPADACIMAFFSAQNTTAPNISGIAAVIDK
jgi:hypothetical protein